MKQAIPLVKACLPAGHGLADKAYDADSLITAIRKTGADVGNPPKSNRLDPQTYYKARYKDRNQLERLLGKLKVFRRVATQYYKRVKTFMDFIKRAAIYLWLK